LTEVTQTQPPMNLIEPLNRNLAKLVLAAADAYAATGDDGAVSFADPLRAARGPFLLPADETPPAPAWLAPALDALPPGALAAPLRLGPRDPLDHRRRQDAGQLRRPFRL
jgi:hypothetical protein